MYLSRVRINETKRETMRALASPGIIHGMLETCFDYEKRARKLWRLDPLNGGLYLLVLSEDEPDFARLTAQIGFSADKGEIRDYSVLLSRIENGQKWRFRLCANPIKSLKTKEGERGKKLAHVTREQQCQWLIERAEKNGFAIERNDFDVVHTRWYEFQKSKNDKQTVTIRTAVFEGLLTVTDAELFCTALTQGIGRAKSYGCGLMTVIRP